MALRKPVRKYPQNRIAKPPKRRSVEDTDTEDTRTPQQKQAYYLRDKLALPQSFLVTLRHTQPLSGDMSTLIYECIEAVKEARLFIGRFTTNRPMNEKSARVGKAPPSRL